MPGCHTLDLPPSRTGTSLIIVGFLCGLNRWSVRNAPRILQLCQSPNAGFAWTLLDPEPLPYPTSKSPVSLRSPKTWRGIIAGTRSIIPARPATAAGFHTDAGNSGEHVALVEVTDFEATTKRIVSHNPVARVQIYEA